MATAPDASRVRPRRASRFVRRQPGLTLPYSRTDDDQRALCEDPEVARGWFRLVEDTVSKYGIDASDIYNSGETGFKMGVISTSMVVTAAERRAKTKPARPGSRAWATVIQGINSQGWAIPPLMIVADRYHMAAWYDESIGLPLDWVIGVSDNGWTTDEMGLAWIRHFDQHTRARTKGVYRLVILDGRESDRSTEFELYCRANSIITLCMPLHSSHILQPLDVGCFGPLKTAYGRQMEDLRRAHRTRMTKPDFFAAFCAAFRAAMTEENIQRGFQRAGLVPFDPQNVILKLHARLTTPTPPNSRPGTAQPTEAASQSGFVNRRVARRRDSSPPSIYSAAYQNAREVEGVMHQLMLDLAALREANELLRKRWGAKETHRRRDGSLSLPQDGQDLQDEEDIAPQVEQETQPDSSRQPRRETRARR